MTTRTNAQKERDEQFETDGNFWIIFWICFAIICIAFSLWMSFIESVTLRRSMIAVMLSTGLFVYLGAEQLKPEERGNYTWMGKFTPKYTPQGGFVFKIPFIQKIKRYDVGMFVINVPYENLTMILTDNAKGITQLTVQISEEYFETLYKVTDGKLDRETIKQKCGEKFKETVPLKLSTAVSILDIQEGYIFEEATKDPNKSLALILEYLLETHTDGSKDCFGLELLATEIPTPDITGEVYEARKKTKRSESSVDLAKAEFKEFGTFLEEYLTNERKNLGMLKDAPFPKEEYQKLKAEATLLFNRSKGNNPQYFVGLDGENVKPIINVSRP